MAGLYRPLAVGVLELRRYLTDRAALAFGIALPIALFALMYATFSGGESFNGTAHIVDADGGAVTAEILSELNDIDGLRVSVHDRDEALSRLDRSAVLSVTVFPAGFSEQAMSGMRPTAIVMRRGSGGQEGQIATSIVRAAAQQVVAGYAARSILEDAIGGGDVTSARGGDDLGELFSGTGGRPVVGVEGRTLGGGDEFLDRLLPGVLVMFLMFAVTFGSQSIVEDRRIGTLERLATTQLTNWQMFTGKFLALMLRASVQILVLLSLAFAVLRVAGPVQFAMALIFALLVAAAVSAMGLIIGALSGSRDQATWASVLVTMFMTVFGGTFYPTDGPALDLLSRFTLNRYAIDAIDGMISGGESLIDQGLEAAVMVAVALAGLAVARALFRVSSR